ncbi:MAG: LysR family transcriptional regulator [bacterium]|nr:LysR family transcriptional regulator [bacterium]
MFEAAARLLSFTHAGHELHLTQSAISQQIKALETHLGRQLFIRRARSLDLTEAGRAYLPIVQRSLDALATGTQLVFGRHDEFHLTVQVNLSFAIYRLAPRLPDFLEAHPDISIDLVTILHEPERTAAAADIEIRFAEDLPGATLLHRNRAYPVCAPERMIDADWRTDVLFDCTVMPVGWRTWLSEQGLSLPPGQRVHLASAYAIGLAIAERGTALTMTLDTYAEPALAEGRLVRPFQHVAERAGSFWLLEAKPGHRSSAADAFRTWLTDTLVS